MAAFVVAKRDTAENRERVVERRVFFPHILIYFEWMLFWMSEKHIMRTYRLPSHAIFNLLQEIKDDLEPSTRSHATPALSKLLANLHFLLASGSFRWLFYSLFATKLIFAALGTLRWSICRLNEMLHLCSFICALLVNHQQKLPFPSALFWNCVLMLICPV